MNTNKNMPAKGGSASGGKKYLKFGGLMVIALAIVFLVTACGQSANNSNLNNSNSDLNLNTNVNSAVNTNTDVNTNADVNTDTDASINANVNIDQEIIEMQGLLNKVNGDDFNGSDLNDLDQ